MKNLLFLKKIFLFAAFFFIQEFLFSYSGVMSGSFGKLKIAKTEYFDIIYAPESEQSANLLYENADSIFEELCALYKLPYKFRTTISISPSNEEFNAYFTSFPYNSIVIYDVPPSESLMVFSKTLLNTFRHELIHAITYNMNNSFWSKVKDIFGDVVNPAVLTTTLGFAEGATVSTESDKGEGRMNSELHKLLVKQAKIEGKFPKYSEIQGSRDTIPGGNLSYYFGGAFNFYLQEKYGFEKYAQFWYNAANIQKFSYLFYFSNFKKVYGISLEEAWNDFSEQIQIPNVKQNPIDEEWIFPPENKNLNRGKEYYSSITNAQRGFYFYDSYRKKIVFLSENGKTKTFLKYSDVSKLSASPDGKFLSVSYSKSSNDLTKTKIDIVNAKTKQIFSVNENSLRDGTIFFSDGNYYLSCVKTLSQKTSIKIYKICTDEKGKIQRLEAKKEFSFPYEKYVFSLAGTMDGKIFFSMKDSLNFSFNSYDFKRNKFFSFYEKESSNFSENVFFLNLNASFSGKISFTFSKKGNLPRLGIFEYSEDFSRSSFKFSENDSSGGVFNANLLENKNSFEKSEKAIFIARRFEDRKILYADLGKMNFSEVEANAIQLDSEKILLTSEQSKDIYDSLQIEKNAEKYSSLSYTFKGPNGVFLPFSFSETCGFSENKNGSVSFDSSYNVLGVSYFSASPWTTPIWGVSASYNPFTFGYAISTIIYGTKGFFSYNLNANLEFDDEGFKQTYDALNFSFNFNFKNNFYISLLSESKFFYGRQSLFEIPDDDSESLFGILKDSENTKYLLEQEKSTLSFGNITSSSSDVNSLKGFQVSAFFQEYFLNQKKDEISRDAFYSNVGFDFLLKIPRLLPFELYNTTLNLPLSVEAAVFPSETYFLSEKTELVLFSQEIQKSTNHLPLFYFNRFTIKTSYTMNFTDDINSPLENFAIKNAGDYAKKLFFGEAEYYDELELNFSLEATPNVGGLARSSFKFSLDSSIFYRFFADSRKNQFGLKIAGISVY